jgi:hypothetical protein
MLLGPDDVADAIRAVRPAGVYSKMKTDQTGSHRKDLGLAAVSLLDALEVNAPARAWAAARLARNAR